MTMQKYRVRVEITDDYEVEIEAENEDEARAAAGQYLAEMEDPTASKEYSGSGGFNATEAEVIDDEKLHEYAFDLQLSVALRVKAPDMETAKATVKEVMHSADSNFGAWPDGSPILGEASLESLGNCYEIDGEPTE